VMYVTDASKICSIINSHSISAKAQMSARVASGSQVRITSQLNIRALKK
jgi:hypothetical protein